MHQCLYARLGKVLLQTVPLLAQDGEDMPHAIPVCSGGQCDERMVDVRQVVFGYLLAPLVFGIQILEFYIQYGRLDLVHAAVFSFIFKQIFCLASVVAQCAHLFGQFVIIGGHSSGVAQCPQVFPGIERVGGSIAQRTRTAVAISASVGLSIVFDEL